MKRTIIAIITAMAISLTCLTGCGQTAKTNDGAPISSGGVLVLSVNPEIAVEYDETGVVTGVTARNDDALAIINSCEGLIGQETPEAVTALVTAIGNAGYFVEEVEGEPRQITLEIEAGSSIPSKEFIDEVVENIRNCVNENEWEVPMDVENESDYGLSDYIDTDYGVDNDGVTDFDGESDFNDVTDYGTDYDGTDYGTDYDGESDYVVTIPTTPTATPGNTDYDDSDYGVSDYNEPQSDYGNSDYSEPQSDYGNSDYNEPQSDYGNSDYNEPQSDYGNSDYNEPQSDYGNSDYNEPESDYEAESAYDESDYDESDYENSDYDD